ncbi:restriction endonuclease [Variovorax sp. IB41]|uniref:restriction endonuclease n=1 Tax=Variovorax sp. IB41 TaxID=2779370 RepID=UPI0018E7B55C|nr:restriction endonuclease [Variovorax sp. IB41]MBJ2159877.1 restriction endonuclease [Variovorax sp. IB41]
MTRIFSFEDLPTADLVVDAIYEGGSAGNAGSDPIAKLLPGAGNQGGFRASGAGARKKFVVLYSSDEEGDWPDRLDLNTGQFVYYGDNRTPGHDLHDTTRRGNLILKTTFENAHGDAARRSEVPPFFVFTKCPTAKSSRAVQFKGLAAPGFPGLPMTEDLVAVWKTTAGERFQNYRSVFTVLDAATIPRAWIDSLSTLQAALVTPPNAWRSWIESGAYSPLTSEPTKVIRTESEQKPDTTLKAAILERVWMHFKDSPHAFEAFAARIYQLTDRRVIIDEITRGSVDGGRDAIGRYLLGLSIDPVYAEFALEAKCYRPALEGVTPTTVGVREVARLISRIRNRQFGVLVTTSLVARQAYEEVRDDRHPIVFISGRDIAEILIQAGYGSVERVGELLGDWPA